MLIFSCIWILFNLQKVRTVNVMTCIYNHVYCNTKQAGHTLKFTYDDAKRRVITGGAINPLVRQRKFTIQYAYFLVNFILRILGNKIIYFNRTNVIIGRGKQNIEMYGLWQYSEGSTVIQNIQVFMIDKYSDKESYFRTIFKKV